MSDSIVERDGNVMVIRFNRPETMNAMGGTMLAEFHDALREARADDSVRSVVVTGEGRAWCSGADLSAVGRRDGNTARPPRPVRLDPKGGPGEHVLALFNLGKPTIAAVNGPAVGGGMGLASAFDFRIASDQARFSTIFIKRALGPDYALSWFLPRLVGYQRALELMMTGRMLSAGEARDYGFVLEVVPHEQLMERAMAFAHELAAAPPDAMTYHHTAMRRSLTNTLDAQMEFEWRNQTAALRSSEFQEAVKAFIEKRPPNFG